MSENASNASELFATAINQPKVTATISALVTSIGFSNLNILLGVASAIVGLIIGLFTIFRMWQSSQIAIRELRIKDLELSMLERKDNSEQ